MKHVIYEEMGILCVTSLENYNTRIQNARLIYRMKDFNDPQEIIDYYCKYFGSSPDDFAVLV